MIILTSARDMYFEKLGFMLTFWNMAGVPFSYCHCALYLASHDPSEYQWSIFPFVALCVGYLFFYWVWDTANGQKNGFRQMERGQLLDRKTWPRLPWLVIRNPKAIETTTGDRIMVDGWFGIVRKPHYTADMYFAISWALITGFRYVCQHMSCSGLIFAQESIPVVLSRLLLHHDYPSYPERCGEMQK